LPFTDRTVERGRANHPIGKVIRISKSIIFLSSCRQDSWSRFFTIGADIGSDQSAMFEVCTSCSHSTIRVGGRLEDSDGVGKGRRATSRSTKTERGKEEGGEGEFLFANERVI